MEPGVTALTARGGGGHRRQDGPRRSHDTRAGKGALHLVSAWASANALTLGQVKTEEKSNEITAIPRLLELLELNGCIVTIDAMGCQKEIAQSILEQGADYVLAVKQNSGTAARGLEGPV